jgi:tyrosyl-tRNA synthetase
MGRYQGLEMGILTPAELKEYHPFMETHDLAGGMWDPLDGDIDPAQLTQALAKGARDAGGHIERFCSVTGIDRDGDGISYTEFSYMVLQSLDFSELFHSKNCTLQIGGSDQWGNITGGVELSRRRFGGQVYGLTLPLVTKADGTKFGKSETGTIWLDPAKTSPYAFYQFWLNTADADAYRFLRYFTFLSVEQIATIEQEDAKAEGRPTGQGVLAEEVTRLVHGDEGLSAARRISSSLFIGDLSEMSESDFRQLRLDGLPSSTLERSEFKRLSLTQILTDSGMAASGKQVKDALGRRSVLINGVSVGSDDNMNVEGCLPASRGLHGAYYLVKLGKKKYHLLERV